MHFAKSEKLDSKVYILYDFIYMISVKGKTVRLENTSGVVTVGESGSG